MIFSQIKDSNKFQKDNNFNHKSKALQIQGLSHSATVKYRKLT
jgi:hypothetical protein